MSNDDDWSVRTSGFWSVRRLKSYADGAEMGVPLSAYSETVSTVLANTAAGSPFVLPHAAASKARPATAQLDATGRRRGDIRCGEDTGRRPSGSTHGECLTSPSPTPSLAAVWRRSVMWS